MGGGLGEERIHSYTQLNSFTAHLKLSQPCKSAIPQYKVEVFFSKKKVYQSEHQKCTYAGQTSRQVQDQRD